MTTGPPDRTPETCLEREPASPGAGQRWACRLAGQAAGTPARVVGPDACLACCQLSRPTLDRWNAVIASLVYEAAAASDSRTRLRALGGLAAEPLPAIPPRVGLIGWNTATGLGSIHRDLAREGVVDRWLIPRHPRYRTLGRPEGLPERLEVQRAPSRISPRFARSWLSGLDWLLFAESPLGADLLQFARRVGVSVACLPMWEWTHPGLGWLHEVDLMLCPNDQARVLLQDWPATFGFPWEVAPFPWPVVLERFPFRPRGICRRFVFVNGRGGCAARLPGGELTPFRRKGLDILLNAAKRLPGIPFLVHSQARISPPVPPNVQVRGESQDPAFLYAEGDVCVQPSRWEGIGLPLLEAMASGLPLVTTDAAPMNEYKPMIAVPPRDGESVWLGGNALTAWRVDPEDLAEALGGLAGRDLSEASRSARSSVEREHSWASARSALTSVLSRHLARHP